MILVKFLINSAYVLVSYKPILVYAINNKSCAPSLILKSIKDEQIKIAILIFFFFCKPMAVLPISKCLRNFYQTRAGLQYFYCIQKCFNTFNTTINAFHTSYNLSHLTMCFRAAAGALVSLQAQGLALDRAINLSYVADLPRGFLKKVMKRRWGSQRDTSYNKVFMLCILGAGVRQDITRSKYFHRVT